MGMTEGREGEVSRSMRRRCRACLSTAAPGHRLMNGCGTACRNSASTNHSTFIPSKPCGFS